MLKLLKMFKWMKMKNGNQSSEIKKVRKEFLFTNIDSIVGKWDSSMTLTYSYHSKQ